VSKKNPMRSNGPRPPLGAPPDFAFKSYAEMSRAAAPNAPTPRLAQPPRRGRPLALDP